MKIIRDHLHSAAPSGIAVYVALTELASDKRAPEFQATHAEIMAKAGILSDRTVRDRISDLEAIGLIAVRENRINERLRAPSTYTLRSVINTDRSVMNNGSGLPREEKNLKNVEPWDGMTAGERANALRIRCPKSYRTEKRKKAATAANA